MMDEIEKIPSAADLIKEETRRIKSSLQKTRGITADMVAAAEAIFKTNPAAPSKLSGTNHRKKTEKLPPNNYMVSLQYHRSWRLIQYC
jgi:hypothetical protein